MRRFLILVAALVVSVATTACASSSPTTTFNPADLVAGDIARGAEVYRGTCAACHGGDAKGINGLGVGLAATEFIANHSEDELAAFIAIGRARNDSASLTGREMPPSGGNPRLTPQDMVDVSAYLISLGS